MGEAGEAQNITHQQKKMDVEAVRAVPRPVRPPGPRRPAREGPVPQAPRRLAGVRVPEGAAQGARRRPAQAAPQVRASRCRSRRSSASSGSSRRPGTARSPPRWRSCSPVSTLAARQGARAARRADRARRGAHVRHGGHVPADRHLEPRRPALHAGGRGAARRTTARTRTARCCRRGSPRRARCASWIAAATVVLHPRRQQMVPFYIYYSMFGFQRVGDFCLGGGRHAVRAGSSSAAPPAGPR